jgi:hypothetical protein
MRSHAFNFQQAFEPILSRHVDVQENKVGTVLGQVLGQLHAVGKAGKMQIGVKLLQRGFKNETIVMIIVNKENIFKKKVVICHGIVA